MGQAARAKEEHTAAGRAPPAASARSPGQDWAVPTAARRRQAAFRAGTPGRVSVLPPTGGSLWASDLPSAPCLINGDSTCPANVLGSF